MIYSESNNVYGHKKISILKATSECRAGQCRERESISFFFEQAERSRLLDTRNGIMAMSVCRIFCVSRSRPGIF